ncbi:MAG: hypothetical protein H6587_02215 [Flavobacteriales bacterium]|nr:hypothetical protein [Flavobacteriales bacterium]MCB9363360.1 hypothetical protein [Flavobacteriales bacterium]
MKYLITLTLILCISNLSFAAKKQHKYLSYEQYIEKYGANQTCVTIIDLFFNKRNLSGIGQMSFLPTTSVVAIIIPPIGIATMAISTPLFVNGLLVRHKYSHKNLVIALEYYQNKKLLSEKFKKEITKAIQDNNKNALELKREEKLLALKQINKSNSILIVE